MKADIPRNITIVIFLSAIFAATGCGRQASQTPEEANNKLIEQVQKRVNRLGEQIKSGMTPPDTGRLGKDLSGLMAGLQNSPHAAEAAAVEKKVDQLDTLLSRRAKPEEIQKVIQEISSLLDGLKGKV